jgi:hypothetical protein
MSIVFTWRKKPSTGLVLILFGLTSLVQSLIVLHAQTTLGITSLYLLAIVPIGVSLALGGVELSLAETLHRRASYREKKLSKWKTTQRTLLDTLFRRLEIASLLSAAMILALSYACYLAVIALCVGTSIPLFARFALAETTSMLVAVVVGILATRIK